jgi:uncharacterized protein
MKIVPDTNVLVSALIRPRGIPAQILTHRADFDLLTSREILAELERVLHYDRIQKKYELSEETITEYVVSIWDDSTIVEVTKPVTNVSPDPDDDKFLACAEAAGADYVVSGDPHLIDLRSYREIPILTPRQFLTKLQHEQS